MAEFIPKGHAEAYWLRAFGNTGLREYVNNFRGPKDHLLGRVFERLGYAVASEMYNLGKYVIIKPGEMSALRRCMTERELAMRPGLPDGIVFERIGHGGILRMIALAEYKVPDVRHQDLERNQFDGFERLLYLMRENNSQQGLRIIREFFGQRPRVSGLEIPIDVSYVYVVPMDRVAEDIPTSLHGRDNFTEVIFPEKTYRIKERIARAFTS